MKALIALVLAVVAICLTGCMNMKSTYTINVEPPKDALAAQSTPAQNVNDKVTQTGGQIVNIMINTNQDKPIDVTTKADARVGDKAIDAVSGAVGAGTGAAIGGVPGAIVGGAAAPLVVEGIRSGYAGSQSK